MSSPAPGSTIHEFVCDLQLDHGHGCDELLALYRQHRRELDQYFQTPPWREPHAWSPGFRLPARSTSDCGPTQQAAWQFNDYTYTMNAGTKAGDVVADAWFSTLTSSSATFSWTAGSGVSN